LLTKFKLRYSVRFPDSLECMLLPVLVVGFRVLTRLTMFVLQASQARLHYLSQYIKKPSDTPKSVSATESQAKSVEEGQ
jgi:hypothetical protein